MKKGLSGSFNDESNQDNTGFIVPTVIRDNKQGGRVAQDVFSRLLSDNTIYLRGVVEQNMADTIVASMMHLYYDKIKGKLESAASIADVPESERTIKFFINSPGGVIDDGLQIYDLMQLLKSEGVIIEAHVTGKAMSMGSILTVGASEGHRYAWPSANIMLHDASGGAQGKRDDMEIRQEEINYISERMKDIYRAHTKLTDDEIEQIFDNPDYYMRAEEATALGIVDKVLYPHNEPRVADMLKKQNERHWQGEDIVKKPKASRVRPMGLPPESPDPS